MLVVAALIEGYFSPMAIPHVIKYFVGTMLWILVFAYLTFAGRSEATGHDQMTERTTAIPQYSPEVSA